MDTTITTRNRPWTMRMATPTFTFVTKRLFHMCFIIWTFLIIVSISVFIIFNLRTISELCKYINCAYLCVYINVVMCKYCLYHNHENWHTERKWFCG